LAAEVPVVGVDGDGGGRKLAPRQAIVTEDSNQPPLEVVKSAAVRELAAYPVEGLIRPRLGAARGRIPPVE
jgi:hypothetical protein